MHLGGAALLQQFGVVDEGSQTVTDGSAGGLGTPADEQPDLVHDGLRRQWLAIDAGVHPGADEVVRWATSALGGHGHEGLDELHVRVDEFREGRSVAFAHVDAHQSFAPTLQLGPHVLGIPEQTTGEACGELTGDSVDDFHLTCVDNGSEQLGGERSDLGVPLLDRRMGEVALHEQPLLTMARVVLGDHVDLLRRPDSAIALTREEHHAATLDVAQVGVTGDAPQPVAFVAVDRFVGAHPGEGLVHADAIAVGGNHVTMDIARGLSTTVSHAERQAGESKYSLYSLIRLNFDLMTGFSIMPLQWFSMLGMVLSLLSGGLVALLLIRRFAFGAEAEGLFTLFAIAFFLMGVILFGIGLLGEYVGRIYQQVRGRPRFVVQTILERQELTEKDGV